MNICISIYSIRIFSFIDICKFMGIYAHNHRRSWGKLYGNIIFSISDDPPWLARTLF